MSVFSFLHKLLRGFVVHSKSKSELRWRGALSRSTHKGMNVLASLWIALVIPSVLGLMLLVFFNIQIDFYIRLFLRKADWLIYGGWWSTTKLKAFPLKKWIVLLKSSWHENAIGIIWLWPGRQNNETDWC